MIRAVIDTNVLISGVITRTEPPRQIVRAVMLRKFDAVVSPQSLAEFERVLNRPQMRHARVDQEAATALLSRLSQLVLVSIDGTPSPILVRDPKDRYLVSTALAILDASGG